MGSKARQLRKATGRHHKTPARPIGSGFTGGPGLLTKEQEKEVFAGLRAAMAEFDANGGTHCHCGGLIYPGGRHTCTHGGTPLTRAEIAAIRAEWRAQKEGE